MATDAFQIATLIGTAIGSMVGSYFVANRATKRRMDSEPPPPRQSAVPALPPPDLGPILKKLESLERELHQEVRLLEVKVAEALTVEEFQTYTTMDGGRREQLIVKIAELQGSLAALFQGMRK